MACYPCQAIIHGFLISDDDFSQFWHYFTDTYQLLLTSRKPLSQERPLYIFIKIGISTKLVRLSECV
jgi:hypothetical protein